MIDLTPLKRIFGSRPLAVLGLGRTGLAVVEVCTEAGIATLAWDEKEEQRREAERRGAQTSDLTSEDLSACAALVVAPGVPHRFPAPHPAVERARSLGLPVVGDFELFALSKSQGRTVAITGTNGKSTTTALVAHILKNAGRRVAVGGNLGTAVLTLEDPGPQGFFVLEMSSYQLETCPSFRADISVLLNLSPDHIERHGDMAGYIAAKKNIFRGPGVAILGADDADTRAVAAEVKKAAVRAVVEISGQNHSSALAAALSDAQALPGTHNAQNAAAAWEVCKACGLNDVEIAVGIRTFPGLEHRQQIVGEIGGVRYINDSKATNAEAAARALACYEPIYWIAGGRAKEGGLQGLEPYMPRVRQAFLIGEAQDDFAQWLQHRHVAAQKCGTLDQATRAAHALAQKEHRPGAVVLLSPACSSFDQFISFEHRGTAFAQAVSLLQEAA